MKLKLAALAVVALLSACSRVEPNQAGVLMENYGRNGKADFSVVVGRVWTIAPGTELYRVPLWEQRGGFSSELELKASDNTEFKAMPVYTFRIKRESAIDVVFDNKQLSSNEAFINSLQSNILEPKIHDLLKEESRKYSTDELMAKGGSLAFEKHAQAVIAKEFARRGLELLSFSVQPKFSENVSKRIDRRNEVTQNIAVLNQKIEEQRKLLELAKLETETNKIRSEGLTDKIIAERFIERWDGKTPLYGNTPMSIMKVEK